MNRFEEVKEQVLARLVLYVPVVARVHGAQHPEFHEVQAMFDAIHEKIRGGESRAPLLDEDFERLRSITENYRVPEDVCESYEAVYRMMEMLDEAYQDR